jgi:hypothetical protein
MTSPYSPSIQIITEVINQTLDIPQYKSPSTRSFSMVEGMSGKVGPAREYAAQARSRVKGDREWCVRVLKRIVGRVWSCWGR